MLIIIKIGKGIFIVTDTFVRRVKNMRPVFVDIDMGFPIILGIAVAADMIAFFDNQNFFAGFFYFMGEDSSKQTGADYYKIIHFIEIFSLLYEHVYFIFVVRVYEE